jgi:hypothetical protein
LMGFVSGAGCFGATLCGVPGPSSATGSPICAET